MCTAIVVMCTILTICSIYLTIGLLCIRWFERHVRKLTDHEQLLIVIGWPVVMVSFVYGFVKGYVKEYFGEEDDI